MKSDRPRTVLNNAERTRVLAELADVKGSTEVVIDHLTLAAARSGSEVSEWTWKRLDALLEAVVDLHQQVLHTPLSGD